MVLKLEFVCTANEERSATAEVFANEYIAKQGLERDIGIASSGTHVARIHQLLNFPGIKYDGGISMKVKKNVLLKAANQNHKLADDFKKFVGTEEFLLEGSTKKSMKLINIMYGRAKKEFGKITDQLLKANLEIFHQLYINSDPTQFNPYSKSDLYLAMGDSTCPAIKELSYNVLKPNQIDTFHHIIGIKEVSPIVMQLNSKKIMEFVKYMEENTPKVIDKALQLHA